MSLTGKMEDEREANAYERGYNDGMKKQMNLNTQKEAEIRADEREKMHEITGDTERITTKISLHEEYGVGIFELEALERKAIAQLFKEIDAIFESGFDKSIFRQYLALKKKHGII